MLLRNQYAVDGSRWVGHRYPERCDAKPGFTGDLEKGGLSNVRTREYRSAVGSTLRWTEKAEHPVIARADSRQEARPRLGGYRGCGTLEGSPRAFFDNSGESRHVAVPHQRIDEIKRGTVETDNEDRAFS